LWIVALVLIVATIILDSSRSGIVILVAGSVFWLGAFAFQQRSPSRLALGVSFLLLLLTALLLFSGQRFERVHLRALSSVGILTDFRWRISHDTFRLIRDSPWCGIGFGNFESIFAIFRDAWLSNQRAMHPESGWLWRWAELGWAAGVALSVVMGCCVC